MTARKECPRDCGFFGECNARDKRSCTLEWKKLNAKQQLKKAEAQRG